MSKRNQLALLIGAGILGAVLALVAFPKIIASSTTHTSGMSNSDSSYKHSTTVANTKQTPPLIVNGMVVQFTRGQAHVTINQQPTTITNNGTTLAIADATNTQNGNTTQDMNGATATPTLIVNGTAVHLTHGQAQVMINRQNTVVALNGNTITITDGAKNTNYGHPSHW